MTYTRDYSDMQLYFDEKLADEYKSLSQKIRVLTEDWVNKQIYCPNCGHPIHRYPNNKPVADFFCSHCQEDYELKSKKNSIGARIMGGAYKTMIERLNSTNNPNLFLLNYNPHDFSVLNFFVIPKHFFVPSIIEKRKPLSQIARRSGWTGCNILLSNIPEIGRIFLVRNKIVEPKEKVITKWKKTLFLREEKESSVRGWLLDIMYCIEKIGCKDFSLSDMYRFESELAKKYPNNYHFHSLSPSVPHPLDMKWRLHQYRHLLLALLY